jgi:hypothetical protein
MGGVGGSGVLNLPNIRGWYVERAGIPDEDGATVDVWVVFVTLGAREVLRRRVTVSNTFSTVLSRNASPTSLDDMITTSTASTPTAFSTLMQATGATPALRQKAYADALITGGVIAVNLRGPTS